MAETPQQRAQRLNTGNKFSGRSFSVLNGQVVSRQDGYSVNGQSDWQDPISGKTVGQYKKPAQRKSTTQNANPFGRNFAPFEMPDNAPIRGIIGQKNDAERSAAPQNANPFAPNFQPFYIPDNAPVRGVIGPRPSNSGGYYGPGGNRDGSGQGQAQQTPGMGPYLGHTPGLPRPSQPSGEPAMSTDTTRNIPGGGTQTGKQMGGGVSAAFVPEYANSSFNDLLAGVNTSGYQPFSSNQLPTTEGNPFAGTAPKTDGFNPAAPGVTGQSYDNYGAAGGAAAVQPGANAESSAFNPNATRIEGGSDRKKGGSLADALNDKEGINSYMSKFSSGDQERAANRAFLDTKGSMAGLRAKEAVNGVVYAGGQHYVAGKSGDDKAVAINRGAARDISDGIETSAGASQKAQDFLAKKTADTVAAVKQAPAVLEQGAKDGAFQQDKPMFSGSTPAIGGAVEFDNNNDKTLPTFGNNGGYKSGFKKIDTTMPNPFGG